MTWFASAAASWFRRVLPGLALLATSCGEDVFLTGTIGNELPLDFNATRIRRQGATLLVEYLRLQPEGTEKLCKLVLDLTGIDTRPVIIRDQAFLDRTVLRRATQVPSEFPDLHSGQANLDQLELGPDGYARGSFWITFENGDSLKGAFSGVVRTISPNEL